MMPAAACREPYKAISVRQPWASLLVRGIKDVENRRWPTHGLHGWVLIHASSCPYDVDGAKWIAERFPRLAELVDCKACKSHNYRGGLIGHARLIGCLRSVVELVTDYRAVPGREQDVVLTIGSPWFVGPYGHVFADACQWSVYDCVSLKGRLGYFSVPAVDVPVRYQMMMKG